MVGIGEVEQCRGVVGNTFGHEWIVTTDAVELAGTHLHLVLCQRAGLVGTDDGGGSHRLAGVHLSHEIIGLEHIAHAVGQTQRHGHRQSLWHGHDDERHGYHDGLERIGQQRGEVLTGIVVDEDTGHQGDEQQEETDDGGSAGLGTHSLEAADDEPEEYGYGQGKGPRQWGPAEKEDQLAHDDGCGNDIAGIGDEYAQPLQLLVERSLHAVVDLRCRIDFSVLRLVANGGDAEDAMTFQHVGATLYMVGGISGIAVEVGLHNTLVASGLTG